MTDLSYEDWNEKQRQSYKDGQNAYDLKIKKLNNLYVDKKQYEKYFNVLGKDNMPNSIVKYQEMKYNDSEKWELFNSFRKKIFKKFDVDFAEFEAIHKNINSAMIRKTTADKILVSSSSVHATQRVVERDITTSEMTEAITKPINDVDNTLRVAPSGQLSKTYKSKYASVVVNPITGKIITTYRDNRQKRNKKGGD